MKAYTDIEQSKKLADILPLESADQTWMRVAIVGTNLNVPEELQYMHNGDIPFQYYKSIGIPCWSLAELLEQLKDRIICDDGRDYILSIYKEMSKYKISYHDSASGGWRNDIETDYYDNLIDACYEMILKLHEQKLL